MLSEYFECRCHSPEHILSFKLFDYDDEPELYAYVLLIPEPFFKRVYNGIKYIFGYTSKYGHFDEFIFNPEDTDRIIELFAKYKELKNK